MVPPPKRSIGVVGRPGPPSSAILPSCLSVPTASASATAQVPRPLSPNLAAPRRRPFTMPPTPRRVLPIGGATSRAKSTGTLTFQSDPVPHPPPPGITQPRFRCPTSRACTSPTLAPRLSTTRPPAHPLLRVGAHSKWITRGRASTPHRTTPNRTSLQRTGCSKGPRTPSPCTRSTNPHSA